VRNALALIKILPLAINLIKSIEEQWPDAGQGAHKLELLKAAIEAIMPQLEIALETLETLWPAVVAFATKAVALFNKSGVFRK
jgi:hypothetical protein